MDKRLTRIDLMFALGFLFMLVVAVAAFFYGVKVGTSQAEGRQTAAVQTKEAEPTPLNAYQLQDLVSFYHTVFLPYREFAVGWQNEQTAWLTDGTADRASAMKELSKNADAGYESVKMATVSPSSPLLQSAQTEFLKSLKLYADSLAALAPAANAGTAGAALEQIGADPDYASALTYGLEAQQQYYDAMIKWAATVNIDIPETNSWKPTVELSRWKTLPLVVKNAIVADYLKERKIMKSYLPQDLTARIDSFVASGQASKMKLKTMSSVADLLTQTDAVRQGDFLDLKVRFYADELLPQLPFFASDN